MMLSKLVKEEHLTIGFAKTKWYITVSEYYQGMLQPKEKDILTELLNEYDNEIVSDTFLQYLMPIWVWWMI